MAEVPPLLVTDVVMPGMNGQVLMQRLLELRPSMKVLFTSGYTANVIVHHGVLREGIEFLAKPGSPSISSRNGCGRFSTNATATTNRDMF